MRMTLGDAKAECERWFSHLADLDRKSSDLQKLAADRRNGLCDEAEGKRRLAAIQSNGVTVYDGSRLHDAVKVLLNILLIMEQHGSLQTYLLA